MVWYWHYTIFKIFSELSPAQNPKTTEAIVLVLVLNETR